MATFRVTAEVTTSDTAPWDDIAQSLREIADHVEATQERGSFALLVIDGERVYGRPDDIADNVDAVWSVTRMVGYDDADAQRRRATPAPPDGPTQYRRPTVGDLLAHKARRAHS